MNERSEEIALDKLGDYEFVLRPDCPDLSHISI